ncbi:MAG TPA: GNAT family N-acetyltransferase [Phycicoccus sp.]|nr:GNAT family N-acetyltransferase [Phycicoccus sp.]
MSPVPARLRPRVPADLPALVSLLTAQRATTGYPVRWPLPFPVEDFIVRPSEIAAWVAVDPARAHAVVGHVSLTEVGTGWETRGWCSGTGQPASRLAAVAVLFVAPRATGRGVGGMLLATAVGHARSLGRTPVLDVVTESSRALALYERAGFRVVGHTRPPWLPPDRAPLTLMALAGGAEPAVTHPDPDLPPR